ncbi:NADPH-dependent FMN reductase [Sphingomicrobium astaxanthinifaciens]|uniref:NADPH-dependent FMN reductase n=1 Tax=Sphingomicrobium astaxanthinifaciens TaxID=1227949 RepID=UPI001FCC1360|nr:NADPH-dependent FMN reductase [Sphingomicrobium astaxanthinifaciens]MCJ7422220.1 NAD(P)H-dependent oxidoreductase [Sphingomicrobium astaxanthinifaciens]
MTRVLAICGSLRGGSYNKAVLEAAAELAPETMAVEVFVPASVALFNEELEDAPPAAVKAMIDKAAAADAILLGNPEYNHSMTGVLKNALDWLSRPSAGQPLKDKPAMSVGASPGPVGTARAHAHLKVVAWTIGLRLWPGPEVLVGNCKDKIEDGRLTDEASRRFLAKSLRSFADWIERLD